MREELLGSDWPTTFRSPTGDTADPYVIAAIQEDEEAADPFLEPERDSVLAIDYAPAGTSYGTISECELARAAQSGSSRSTAYARMTAAH
jgi:hypothetical protein